MRVDGTSQRASRGVQTIGPQKGQTMASRSDSQREATLDSIGPWAVWIGIAVLLSLSVGVMLEHSVGIENTAPTAAATASAEAHQYAHR
jgi:hypothetical protein